MARIIVPPIKTQGIKTKLVPWIQEHVQIPEGGKWVEPFMGSGVVGFNVKPERAIFSDTAIRLMKAGTQITLTLGMKKHTIPVERNQPVYRMAHHVQPQLFEKSIEYKAE